jgi:sulfofructose kinase
MTAGPEFDILGFGTMAVDEFLYVTEYPPVDGKARVVGERRRCGGLIATALAAASRLGACCAYAAVFGDDALSCECLAALAAAGVRDDLIVREPGAGPVRSVIVAEEGRGTRTIFYNKDRLRPYPSNHLGRLLPTRARVIVLDHLGIESMLPLSRLAASLGVPVVADVESRDHPAMVELVRSVSHLILPLGFARAISGRQEPAEVVRTLHREAHRACTAVTCGTGGCYFAAGDSNEDVHHQPAFAVETRETTGCGDVFHGAYAAALSGGNRVPECVRFAAAAAAVYASRPSGWEYLPGPEDVKLMAG